MDDVYKFPRKRTSVDDDGINLQIISELEYLLEKARNHEINSISWAYYTTSNDVAYGWVWAPGGSKVLRTAIEALLLKYDIAVPEV